MEHQKTRLEIFEEPLDRLRQVAGDVGLTNAAGRDLNQFKRVQNVYQHYHYEVNFSDLLDHASRVSAQIPLAQAPFRKAFNELSAFESILSRSSEAAERAPVRQEQEERLEDAQEDAGRTLTRLQSLIHDYQSWTNEQIQRWLQGQGHDDLQDIVRSLRRHSDRLVEFQQEIQPISDSIIAYMRNRAEDSIISDEKVDELLTEPENWEDAKNDMIRWGMSGRILEEKKVEVIQLMQDCRDLDINQDRLREHALEFEYIYNRPECDSQTVDSDGQDEYLDEEWAVNDTTVSTKREAPRPTTEISMLRMKAAWDGGKTLIELTKEGDILAVETLLDAYVSPNAYDEKGMTSLHWAARLGYVDIANLLIQKGALVDPIAEEGRTPLYVAAVYKRHEVVSLLLQNDASTRATGINDNFPIHEAAYAGSSLGMTPLILSAHGISPRATICLLRRGAKTDIVDKTEMTALATAAFKGNLATVRVLLEKDAAQLERKDVKGNTPLVHAVMKQRVDVTEFLVSKKADISVKTTQNRSILAWAAYYGTVDLLDIILAENLDVNAPDSRGFTPLHLAANAGRWQNVRRLLDTKYRPVIAAKTYDGWTPLHEACNMGRLKAVEVLVSKTAPINARDRTQWTPLHRAASAGHLDVVNYLIKKEADIEARNISDWTPLHEAVVNGFASIVRVFLENGASTTAFDNYGLDALQKARSGGQQEIIQMIEKHEAKLNLYGLNNEPADEDSAYKNVQGVSRDLKDAKTPQNDLQSDGNVSISLMAQIVDLTKRNRLSILIGVLAMASGLAIPRSISRGLSRPGAL